MRVLLINPHIFSRGAEMLVISTARWLNKLGIDCDILSLSLELESTEENEGVRFLLPSKQTKYSTNATISGAVKRYFLEFYRLLLEVEKIKDNYDVFNPHNFPSYWVFGLAKRQDARVVWTCHNVFDYGQMIPTFKGNWVLRQFLGLIRAFDRKTVSQAIDAIVTVSNSYAKEVFRVYGRPSYVIPPGIEVEKYAGDGDVFKGKYEFSDVFLAVHVGALIRRKRQDTSIKAISILKDSIPNLRLAVIGEGPDKEKLRELACALGVERRVIFTGRITRDDLKNAYSAADVNLLPSTIESFGLTPIEALASDTISIVSNEAGVAEYLKTYDIGYVMKSRSPRELAKLILHVYRNRDEVEEKLKKGMDILRTKFSWTNYIKNLLQVYQGLGNRRELCSEYRFTKSEESD